MKRPRNEEDLDELDDLEVNPKNRKFEDGSGSFGNNINVKISQICKRQTDKLLLEKGCGRYFKTPVTEEEVKAHKRIFPSDKFQGLPAAGFYETRKNHDGLVITRLRLICSPSKTNIIRLQSKASMLGRIPNNARGLNSGKYNCVNKFFPKNFDRLKYPVNDQVVLNRKMSEEELNKYNVCLFIDPRDIQFLEGEETGGLKTQTLIYVSSKKNDSLNKSMLDMREEIIGICETDYFKEKLNDYPTYMTFNRDFRLRKCE